MTQPFKSTSLNSFIRDNDLAVHKYTGPDEIQYKFVHTPTGELISDMSFSSACPYGSDYAEFTMENNIECILISAIKKWKCRKHRNQLQYTFESKCLNRALNNNDLIVIANPCNNGVDATDYIVLHTPTDTEIGRVMATVGASEDKYNFETHMGKLICEIIDKWKDIKHPDKLSISETRHLGYGDELTILDVKTGREMAVVQLPDEFYVRHRTFVENLKSTIHNGIKEYNQTD